MTDTATLQNVTLRDLPELHDLTDLDAASLDLLDTYRFSPGRFAALRRRLRSGRLSPATNLLSGVIEPPAPEDLVDLPEPGTDAHERASGLGVAALRSGAVASVVLNGGMATRFGGRVKGVVEAVDGRSFLQVKVDQAAELSAEVGTEPPCVLMNSFATDARTREFVAEHGIREPLYVSQSVSLRLTPDGELLRTDDGRVCPYAPGHGDLLASLRLSGVLGRLRRLGVRYLMVSNIDNLAATLDPVVTGVHIAAGRPMTVEVAPSTGSPGGAPARVDGRTVLVEGTRIPAGFDRSSLTMTNVNTMTFDLEALARDYRLTWLYVEKSVRGRTAVQFEQLLHEVSAFVPTTYLRVPSVGPRTRFVPVKTPEDLAAAQPLLREVLRRPAAA